LAFGCLLLAVGRAELGSFREKQLLAFGDWLLAWGIGFVSHFWGGG